MHCSCLFETLGRQNKLKLIYIGNFNIFKCPSSFIPNFYNIYQEHVGMNTTNFVLYNQEHAKHFENHRYYKYTTLTVCSGFVFVGGYWKAFWPDFDLNEGF